ncbi:hypothetical protein BDV29DRAFT_60533 [Aspergillus leporis]|uniref:Uncharacterized protein n=1 Tax=Aspergillus leporis TaxID=41062 RepID=A0A5N5WKN4_9EURO|nr:hypothetical protein BDV29DRAFT_60533 [Aspergillus leporis]
MKAEKGIGIDIDRGCTFTDCRNLGTGRIEDDVWSSHRAALGESEPHARRILSKFTGRDIPRGEPVDTSLIWSIC